MKNNNQVVIERDMYCPYCDTNSAVIISETTKKKSTKGCAALGLKNGCLLTVTGGCWAIVSGFPLIDEVDEYQTVNYGFCPCCGNTYPIAKPESSDDIVDRFQNSVQGAKNTFNKAKDMFNNGNGNK